MKFLKINKQYTKDLKKVRLTLAQKTLLGICINAITSRVKVPPSANIKKLTGEWKGYRSIKLGFDLRVIFRCHDEQLELVRIGTHNQLYK
jgi:addiction module RelE/StbE family toxin